MEHIFYLSVYLPLCSWIEFCSNLITIFPNEPQKSIGKILCFFHFISLPEHDFSIFARKCAKFHLNLMSKFCAQNRRIYPVLPSKMHNFSLLMSKRLCSISPLLAGPFHYFEHKIAKKMIQISFHFINPRSTGKNPWFLGTKIPRSIWVGWFPVSSLITKYCSLFFCSLVCMTKFIRRNSFRNRTFTTE
jgi:hypothetical protein